MPYFFHVWPRENSPHEINCNAEGGITLHTGTVSRVIKQKKKKKKKKEKNEMKKKKRKKKKKKEEEEGEIPPDGGAGVATAGGVGQRSVQVDQRIVYRCLCRAYSFLLCSR